jgi:hypothetical protein
MGLVGMPIAFHMKKDKEGEMKSNLTNGILVAAFLFSLMTLSGCSVIGYGIGTAIDNSKENYRNTEKWELDEAKKGRKIRMTLEDGEVINGKYKGLDSLDYLEYSTKCNNGDNQSMEGEDFPCPDDSITIVTATNDSVSGRLLGYDINYTLDREEDNTSDIYQKSDLYRVSIKSTQDTMPRYLLLTGIKSFATQDSNPIDGGLLQETVASENLPLRSAINVRVKWDEHQFPVDQVDKIEIDSAHNTKYLLMVVGLAIDGFCIAMAIALSQMEIGLGSGGGGSW